MRPSRRQGLWTNTWPISWRRRSCPAPICQSHLPIIANQCRNEPLSSTSSLRTSFLQNLVCYGLSYFSFQSWHTLTILDICWDSPCRCYAAETAFETSNGAHFLRPWQLPHRNDFGCRGTADTVNWLNLASCFFCLPRFNSTYLHWFQDWSSVGPSKQTMSLPGSGSSKDACHEHPLSRIHERSKHTWQREAGGYIHWWQVVVIT